MENNLEYKIKDIAKIFLEKTKNKEIQIISHFDVDGITSAAIMIQTLKKLDKRFTLKIIKSLDEEFIKNLSKEKTTLFLDLCSNNLKNIEKHGFKEVFIIDHHEITQEIPKNVQIINPQLHEKQKISASGLTYLFSKEINSKNKKLAKLAILGMIGDRLEKEIGKLNKEILENSEIQKKRGLLIYPSTRPLNRTLEYSSNPYIPGVSGEIKGVLELLREAGITPLNGKYKSLLELNEEEMKKLITSILLRKPHSNNKEIIGDIFLIKFYNQLEDARELCAKINACSRSGKSEEALQFCLELPNAKKKIQSIHSKYKQELISSLKLIPELEKIQGSNYLIINAKDKIKDTMIGTIISILSNSPNYKKETMIFALAHYKDKIKISARIVGESEKNLSEILNKIIIKMNGEVGGHKSAAGGIISINQEKEFINELQKNLEIEIIEIKSQ